MPKNTDNPLKSEKQSKTTTRALADNAPNPGHHTSDVNHPSQQGGTTANDAGTGERESNSIANRSAGSAASSDAASSQQGARSQQAPSGTTTRSGAGFGTSTGGGGGGDRWTASPQSAPASGVKRNGPSPADEKSSNRTGTAPDRSGGPSRSGRSKGERRKEGRDV
jgi:hypothetical protein